jgi:predicted RecB family nuclease
MKVTAALFEAHLRCHTKSKLYSESTFEAGAGALRPRGESSETSEFVQQASDKLLAEFSPEQCHVGNPSLQAVAAKQYSLIVNYAVDQADFHTQIHALVLARVAKELSDIYIPVRFVPGNTVTTIDRLRLAFDAVAINRALGENLQVGRIIHGGCRTVLTINLSGLVERVLLTCAQIEAQNLNPTPPPLVLNRHCGECEFQSRCRQIAIEKDDLSLLRNMTAKERGKLNDKGIFTVTQLSYTFRPRKVMALKHHHSLKALAVRTKQIHVLGSPTFAIPGTAVFFDVEGDGNAGSYYLIGLNYGINDSQAQRSFWADDKFQEGTIWSLFLSALAEIEKPILIHYGAYEAEFLRKMKDRYPGAAASSFVDKLIANALNVLSLTYSQIYFPTYSNSLKDIDGCIWFQLSLYGATGRTASEWRSAWNSSRDPGLKQQLITYNTEDCVALRKVSEAIMSVMSEDPPRIGDVEAVKVGPLTSDYPRQFGEVAFVLPEFKEINKAAYWDYQRDRVYIRSSSRLKHIASRGTKSKSTRPNGNQ